MILVLARHAKLLVLSVLLAGASLPWVRATEILPQCESNPSATFEGVKLPNPIDVTGKQYISSPDKDAAGNLDPGQVINWKGDGTTVWDSVDYYTGAGGGSDVIPFQTDSISNIRCKYFLDLDGTRAQVYSPEGTWERDTVSLAVSLQKKPGTTINDGYQNNIYASRSAYRGGGAELWADWKLNINKNMSLSDDLNGLLMNGLEGANDANMYSREADPNVDGLGRVSIFRYYRERVDPGTGQLGLSVPYLRTDVLRNAVIKDDGSHPNWNVYDPNSFDVDAIMTWDITDDDHFGPGDKLLFSVRPLGDLFDGGEIWLCTCDKDGNVTADFLKHGSNDDGSQRTWNTQNEVSKYFFAGDDTHGENIDALSAIAPEPSTLIMLFVPAAFFAWRRFRR
jgi:hypothetical protein